MGGAVQGKDLLFRHDKKGTSQTVFAEFHADGAVLAAGHEADVNDKSDANLSEKAQLAQEIIRHAKAKQTIRARASALASTNTNTLPPVPDSDINNPPSATSRPFPDGDLRNDAKWMNDHGSIWLCGAWDKTEIATLKNNTGAKQSWIGKCEGRGLHEESVCSPVANDLWKGKDADGDFFLDQPFCAMLLDLTMAELKEEEEHEDENPTMAGLTEEEQDEDEQHTVRRLMSQRANFMVSDKGTRLRSTTRFNESDRCWNQVLRRGR